ncbi:unnamed protein product [Hapterophycus canaliculatus]
MDLSPFNMTIFGPGISRWDSKKAGSLDARNSKAFDTALNEMGQMSSKAQQQTAPLTTADKLRENADIVYIACDSTGGTVQGFLRLGRKHLFLYPDGTGPMIERETTCLLDFYVHESVQRQGIGIDLFRSALKEERLTPTEIAYDRPSPKLKPFLAKHFGLHNCLDQPNRFMVFTEHFGLAAAAAAAAASLEQQAG